MAHYISQSACIVADWSWASETALPEGKGRYRLPAADAYCLLFTLGNARSYHFGDPQQPTCCIDRGALHCGQAERTASPGRQSPRRRRPELIPSVTRVFSKAKALYIHLRGYDQGDAPVNPLLAYATFYLDGRKAFETTAIEIVDATPNRLKTMPLRFSVPVGQAGRRRVHSSSSCSRLQRQNAAFWQAPIMVVR